MSGPSVTGCLSTEDDTCATAEDLCVFPFRALSWDRTQKLVSVPVAETSLPSVTIRMTYTAASRTVITIDPMNSPQLHRVSVRADPGSVVDRLIAMAEVITPGMARRLQQTSIDTRLQISAAIVEPLGPEAEGTPGGP
jgi:hypothetical protein